MPKATTIHTAVWAMNELGTGNTLHSCADTWESRSEWGEWCFSVFAISIKFPFTILIYLTTSCCSHFQINHTNVILGTVFRMPASAFWQLQWTVWLHNVNTQWKPKSSFSCYYCWYSSMLKANRGSIKMYLQSFSNWSCERPDADLQSWYRTPHQSWVKLCWPAGDQIM